MEIITIALHTHTDSKMDYGDKCDDFESTESRHALNARIHNNRETHLHVLYE